MLLNVSGYRYGETVNLPDDDRTWQWFSSGVCAFADDDYGTLNSDAVVFAELDAASGDEVADLVAEDDVRAELQAGMFRPHDEATSDEAEGE